MIPSASEGGKNLNQLIDSKYKVLLTSRFYQKNKIANHNFFWPSQCFGGILILLRFADSQFLRFFGFLELDPCGFYPNADVCNICTIN